MIPRMLHDHRKRLMRTCGNFFRRHTVALFIALAVALLYGLSHPILAGRFAKEGVEYYPTIVTKDERYFTVARTKGVFLYGAASGDVATFEHRDAPAGLPTVPHLIMGYLARALGSVKAAFITADYLFPPLAFFLLYLLMYELSGRRIVACSFATLMAISPRLLAFVPLWNDYYQSWFFTQLFRVQSRLPLDRFEDPELTLPFFALSLYLIIRSLNRGERATTTLAGISFGVLFYIYFYYSTYLAVALFIMLGLSLLLRRGVFVRRLAEIIGLGLFTSIPHWLNFLHFRELPAYTDFEARIGPERGRYFYTYPIVLFAYLQQAVLAGATLFLFLRRHASRAVFLAGLLLAIFIVYNIQLLTGFNPQPDHWIKPRQIIVALGLMTIAWHLGRMYSTRISPKILIAASILGAVGFGYKALAAGQLDIQIVSGTVSLLLLAAAVVFFLRRHSVFQWRKIGHGALVAAICLLIVKGALTQRNFIRESMVDARLPTPVAESIEWLNEHTPQGSVIGTLSFETNSLILNLTENNVFVADGFLSSTSSNRELQDRLYRLAALMRLSPAEVGRFFATEATYPPKHPNEEGLSYLFADMLRARERGSIFTNRGFRAPVLSKAEHQTMVADYEVVIGEGRLTIPYKLDYIYIGTDELTMFPELAKIKFPDAPLFQNEAATIWRFKSSYLPEM